MNEELPPLLQNIVMLLDEGMNQEARALLSKYLEQNPRSDQAWFLMSYALVDRDQVMKCLLQALHLNPDHPLAQERIEELTGLASVPETIPTARPEERFAELTRAALEETPPARVDKDLAELLGAAGSAPVEPQAAQEVPPEDMSASAGEPALESQDALGEFFGASSGTAPEAQSAPEDALAEFFGLSDATAPAPHPLPEENPAEPAGTAPDPSVQPFFFSVGDEIPSAEEIAAVRPAEPGSPSIESVLFPVSTSASQEADAPGDTRAEPASSIDASAEETSAPPAEDEVGQAPTGSPPAKKRRGKWWIIDVLLVFFILCSTLAIVGYFTLEDLADVVIDDLQQTQQVAQTLTALPVNTLPATWTPTITLTSTPTNTPTPPLTATATLEHTLTRTPPPPSAIGLTAGMYPPDFRLTDLGTGEQVTLRQFIDSPVVIFFWATWCPNCRAEIPDLEAIYQAYKDAGLVILAVSSGEEDRTVRTFRDQNGLDFSILLDPGSLVLEQFEVDAIPRHFFIRSNGRIASVIRGRMTYNELDLQVKTIMIRIPTPTP